MRILTASKVWYFTILLAADLCAARKSTCPCASQSDQHQHPRARAQPFPTIHNQTQQFAHNSQTFADIRRHSQNNSQQFAPQRDQRNPLRCPFRCFECTTRGYELVALVLPFPKSEKKEAPSFPVWGNVVRDLVVFEVLLR